MNSRWISACAVAAAVAVPTTARAQQPAPAIVAPARDGLAIGFGLHAGSLIADCDDQDDVDCDIKAGGLDLHVGWFLGPSLSLQLDVWGMYHTEDFLTIYQTITTVAAQVWLKGGLGHARAGYEYDGILVDVADETEDVPGVMIGVGYEVVVGRSFVLDIQGRYGTGKYDNTKGHNASIGVGFNWY